LQQVVGGDSAARGVPDDGHSVSSLEIGLDQLIVATIAEDHATQLQAFHAQQIDGLLTFIGESKIFRIPSEEIERKLAQL
jgi:hypothetical protein